MTGPSLSKRVQLDSAYDFVGLTTLPYQSFSLPIKKPKKKLEGVEDTQQAHLSLLFFAFPKCLTIKLPSTVVVAATHSILSLAIKVCPRTLSSCRGSSKIVTMFFDGYGYHGTSFEQTYRCYPASFIDKPQIENGDKIIMPPSALDRLASLHIDYPMLFELQNAATERVSHCGVLEFIAEEGMIYMPYWMMENLLLREGDVVRVKNVTLPKGTYVKLQPHTKDFLDISNPKAILETTLRNFSCLTTEDSIMVAYNNKKYYIDIIETKPSNAITIIETDCEVDFAPPLDYKEPEKPTPSPASSKAPAEGQEIPTDTEPKFNPFSGMGRRLDGKPLKYEPPPVSSSSSRDKRPEVSNAGAQPSAGSSSQSTSRQSQGKLVFGSNQNRARETQKEPSKETKREEPEKKEEPKFQPFTGKKYSLKG
ncbi:hypothetical protein ACH5RR_021995 [Cinchona calisaya]|uniref:Ubiquitin fusion degradaton protein n=1 Tax=Cinchona calisaya TaxID=153742 RepID=A0ABD2Z7L5_9GENT